MLVMWRWGPHRSERGVPVALLLAFSRIGMMLLSLGVVSYKQGRQIVDQVDNSTSLLWSTLS